MDQLPEENKQQIQQKKENQPYNPDEYKSPQKFKSLWPLGEKEEQLFKWIAESTGLDPKQLNRNLVYKASENYWLGYDFHSRVDEIKNNPTVLLIQTVEGDYFGGFTSRCWGDPKKEHRFQADNKCFLFSFTNNKKIAANPPSGEENFGGGIIQSWVHGFYFQECGYQHLWQLQNEATLGNSCDPEYIGKGFKNTQPMCKEILDNNVHKFPKCRYEFKDEPNEDDRLKGDDYYTVKMLEIEVYEISEK